MSLSKTIVLSSSDGERFEVDEAVAMESQTIQHMIETGGADTTIGLPQVTGKTLSKVIEYCKKHVESAPNYNEDDLKSFDADFIKVEQSLLFDLIQAAHDLNIESLLELGCKTVVDMIKYKNPEQIRQTFNIVNDFTPEEQKEIDRENARVSIIYRPNPSSSS